MSQQGSWRLGWQSQNLARFLLYRFCFLAEPVQIADDIGIDFFCTIFESKHNCNNTSLIPRNSFAIQVKSHDESSQVDLDSLLPCLESLELPFFIGMVDRTRLSMALFSGEFLTPLFAYKGRPMHLTAQLCERSRIRGFSDWLIETSPGSYTLVFPRITEITANMGEELLEDGVKEIQERCSQMLDNIAATTSKEFILRGAAPLNQLLFAGPESLKYFEANFLERLSEVFYNLNWAYSVQGLAPQVKDRFLLYEQLYLQLVSHFGETHLPDLLRTTYHDAKSRICF